jgi:hypothetical protein
MERKKYAKLCAIAVSLGAAVGMFGFFVKEPTTNAKVISFDLACVKAHLDAHTQGVDIVTDC